MYVYRLCRAPFTALDGEGARLYGGRWNSPGRRVVYTSTTLALAALEYLVHIEPADVPVDLTAVTINIPDEVGFGTIDASALPRDWAHATGSAACQAMGDEWLSNGAVGVLRVPAAPIPQETNVLLNPRQKDAPRFKIVAERPFVYDPRLLV